MCLSLVRQWRRMCSPQSVCHAAIALQSSRLFPQCQTLASVLSFTQLALLTVAESSMSYLFPTAVVCPGHLENAWRRGNLRCECCVPFLVSCLGFHSNATCCMSANSRMLHSFFQVEALFVICGNTAQAQSQFLLPGQSCPCSKSVPAKSSHLWNAVNEGNHPAGVVDNRICKEQKWSQNLLLIFSKFTADAFWQWARCADVWPNSWHASDPLRWKWKQLETKPGLNRLTQLRSGRKWHFWRGQGTGFLPSKNGLIWLNVRNAFTHEKWKIWTHTVIGVFCETAFFVPIHSQRERSGFLWHWKLKLKWIVFSDWCAEKSAATLPRWAEAADAGKKEEGGRGEAKREGRGREGNETTGRREKKDTAGSRGREEKGGGEGKRSKCKLLSLVNAYWVFSHISLPRKIWHVLSHKGMCNRVFFLLTIIGHCCYCFECRCWK